MELPRLVAVCPCQYRRHVLSLFCKHRLCRSPPTEEPFACEGQPCGPQAEQVLRLDILLSWRYSAQLLARTSSSCHCRNSRPSLELVAKLGIPTSAFLFLLALIVRGDSGWHFCSSCWRKSYAKLSEAHAQVRCRQISPPL